MDSGLPEQCGSVNPLLSNAYPIWLTLAVLILAGAACFYVNHALAEPEEAKVRKDGRTTRYAGDPVEDYDSDSDNNDNDEMQGGVW